MSTRRVRVAVIGTGFMGRTHCEAVGRAGAELVGIVGSTPGRADELAASFGAHSYGTLDELLAGPADVVHVTSPNHLHAEHAAAALRAGKHLVCEKPLTLTSAEARALVELAEESGLVAATCFNLRFYPLVQEMRARIARGAAPTLVRGSYLQDWLLHDDDWNWRVDVASGGATRAVADIGSHLIDLLCFVLGRDVVGLQAHLVTTVPERVDPSGERVAVVTDDAAQLLLKWEDGVRGVLSVSQVSPGRKNQLAVQIDCRDEGLAWESEDPDRLWIGLRDQPNQILHRDPATLTSSVPTFYPGGHVEGYAETFRGLLEQVYADVLAGGPQPGSTYASLADGARSVAITEAVLQSSREGRWIKINQEER